MSSYEEKVRDYDGDLYESIKDHVKEIPDARPMETVKKMKKVSVEGEETHEPQDHWRMVYEELVALSLNSYHRNFFNTIMHNDLEKFSLYFVDDILLSEIPQSYPALVWLLHKISPEECTWAYYISQGLYLLDIPMKEEYISYIRSFGTVHEIREIHGDCISLSDLGKFILGGDTALPFLGHLYWFHEICMDQYLRFSPSINTLIIKQDNMELAKAFFP